MNKQADLKEVLSSISKGTKGFAESIGKVLKGGAAIGSSGYAGLDRLAWYILPTASILGILGTVRTLRPEAVAENADRLLLQDTLTSSLAKSIRKYEQMGKDKEAEEGYNSVRKHDRFV